MTRAMVVRLERNCGIEARSHLQHAPTNQTVRAGRRVSVASTNIFQFGNNLNEAGFDHFQRIPRSAQVNINDKPSTSRDAIAIGENVIAGLIQQNPNGSSSSTAAMFVPNTSREAIPIGDIVVAGPSRHNENISSDSSSSTVAMVGPNKSREAIPIGENVLAGLSQQNQNGSSGSSSSTAATVVPQSEAFLEEDFDLAQFFDQANDPLGDNDDFDLLLFADPSEEAEPNEPNQPIEPNEPSEPSVPNQPNEANGRLFNDFQPFARVKNLPFSLTGRPRSLSIDSLSVAPPSAPLPYVVPPMVTPAEQEALSNLAHDMDGIRLMIDLSTFQPPPLQRTRRQSIMMIPELETIAEDEDEALNDIHNLFD